MKKLLNLLVIASFAAIPLFAITEDSKSIEVPKDEITLDDSIKVEEPKDEIVVLDDLIVKDDVSDDVILNDEEVKDEEVIE